MATTTPNLGLKKPANSDAVLVSDLNDNADKLDEAIGRLALLSTEKKSSLVDAINEAAQAAGNAERDAQSANTRAEALAGALNDANEQLGVKIDGAYVEDGYLYLTANGVEVVGPLGPFGSGGGSGSSTSYSVSLANLLDSRTLTAAEGGSVNVQFRYASVDENENDDGPGIGTVTVNGVKKATLTIPQGDNTLDVSAYLAAGTNTVKIRVENSEGSSRTLAYTVTVVTLSMATTFDDMGMYSGSVVFSYTVTGSGTKTVHFLMDGEEIGSEEVSSSGRSRSYPIAEQAAGAHVLTAYAEATVDGVTVKSNTLRVGMLWISDSMSTPAILSTFDRTEATQGEILTIPWMVYDPQGETASVTLSVLNPDGSTYAEKVLTVDRAK